MISINIHTYGFVLDQWFKDKYKTEFDVEVHDCDEIDVAFGINQLGLSYHGNSFVFDVVDEKKYLLAKIAYGFEDEPYEMEEEES